MKKKLFTLLACLASVCGATTTAAIPYPVAEADTVEHKPSEPVLINWFSITPQCPTKDDEITLTASVAVNCDYRQQVEIDGNNIYVNGQYSTLANCPIENKLIEQPLGKLPVGTYTLEQHIDMTGDNDEVIQEAACRLQFEVLEYRVDTGEVAPPNPGKPSIFVPTIREDANVTEYPHNPAFDKMLSSAEPIKQEFTMTIEGEHLRIKGTLMARGYDKHYIDCQIIGDSVHLQRFDMDPESTDMLLHYVDILIPGFTEDYYHVTLAEQNDVPLYREYMVMSRGVARASNIAPEVQTSPIQLQPVGNTLRCIAPTAVKMEVYTMDATKVGEASFVNNEATVTVGKAPATYLCIVTYPDGRRESGKVMVSK